MLLTESSMNDEVTKSWLTGKGASLRNSQRFGSVLLLAVSFLCRYCGFPTALIHSMGMLVSPKRLHSNSGCPCVHSGEGICRDALVLLLSLWGHWSGWFSGVTAAKVQHSWPAVSSSSSFPSGPATVRVSCWNSASVRPDTPTGSKGKRFPLGLSNSAAVEVRSGESCLRTERPVRVGLNVTSSRMTSTARLIDPGRSLRKVRAREGRRPGYVFCDRLS